MIFESGTWSFPDRNGVVPSKPPLYHWCVAAAAAVVGGVTPEIARGVSVMFAVGTLYLTYLLGVVVIVASKPEERNRAKFFGVASAGVLSTTYGFHRLALEARVDMAFAFFVVLAIYAVCRRLPKIVREGGDPGVNTDYTDYVLFWIASACAVLTKGPLGLLLPMISALAILTVVGGYRSAFKAVIFGRGAACSLLFLALTIPWYFAAISNYGTRFIDKQLLFENIERFIGGDGVNSESSWFYISSLLGRASPWFLVLVFWITGASCRKLRQLRVGTKRNIGIYFGERANPAVPERDFSQRIVIGMGAAFFLSLVFFSLSAGKRHSYLLPLYPLQSVIVAFVLHEYISKLGLSMRHRAWRAARVIPALVASMAILVALVLEGATQLVGASNLAVSEAASWLSWRVATFEMALFLLAGCTLLLSATPSISTVLYAAWLTVVGVATVVISVGLGAKNALKPFRLMAFAINNTVDRQSSLTVVKGEKEEFFDPILYYLNREVAVESYSNYNISSCSGYFLALSDQFEILALRQRRKGIFLKAHKRYNLISDELKDLHAREIVIFSCEMGREFNQPFENWRQPARVQAESV